MNRITAAIERARALPFLFDPFKEIAKSAGARALDAQQVRDMASGLTARLTRTG